VAELPPNNGAAKAQRGPLFRLVLAVCLLAGGVWTVRFVHRAIIFEETDNAYLTAHIHQISSRLAGSVTEVLVTENQPVKKGQILARLDPLGAEIALQKAKASLAQQKAGALQLQAALEEAAAARGQADAQSSSADSKIERLEAELEVAKINFGRNQRLFQNDARAVSKSEVDTTKGNAQASTAALEGAKADALAAKARVAASAAAVEAARADVESAKAKVAAEEASVRDAERELSYAVITAPADGRIGNRNVEVGNRIQVGQALFALVGNECWIVANFKETQLRQMRPAQPVEITIDAMDGRQFSGRVDSIAPATGAEFAMLPPDNATGNFTKVVQRVPVKIIFDPQSIQGLEDRLRPGLSTVVSVRVK
jgi:membrane fusion protein (multidrug efflux system)